MVPWCIQLIIRDRHAELDSVLLVTSPPPSIRNDTPAAENYVVHRTVSPIVIPADLKYNLTLLISRPRL